MNNIQAGQHITQRWNKKSFLTAANPGTDSFRKDQICKEHVNINKNIPVKIRKLVILIHSVIKRKLNQFVSISWINLEIIPEMTIYVPFQKLKNIASWIHSWNPHSIRFHNNVQHEPNPTTFKRYKMIKRSYFSFLNLYL